MTQGQVCAEINYQKVRFLGGGRVEQIRHCLGDPIFPDGREDLCAIERQETIGNEIRTEIFLVRELTDGNLGVCDIFLTNTKVVHVLDVRINDHGEALVKLTMHTPYKYETAQEKLICVPLE